MNANDDGSIVEGLSALRAEIVELKELMRELLAAVGKLDASTNDSAAKITSAIQRWT